MAKCVCAGARGSSRGRGFTLIELLIALAVVGILSAIAWPSYDAVIRRAQRQDARLALLELQHEEERHYLRHFAYSDRLTGSRAEGGLAHSGHSPSGEYLLSVTLRADGQGFVAQAVADAQSRQARDLECARFTVDEKGRRTATDSTGNDSAAACWP